MICDSASDGSHNQLIALEEVNHVAQVLENDKIRLHPDDAVSTRLLLEHLASNISKKKFILFHLFHLIPYLNLLFWG